MPSTRRTRVPCTVKPPHVHANWLAAHESSAYRLNARILDPRSPPRRSHPCSPHALRGRLPWQKRVNFSNHRPVESIIVCSNQRVRAQRKPHQQQHCPDHRAIKRLQFDSLSLRLWQVSRQAWTLCRFDALMALTL